MRNSSTPGPKPKIEAKQKAELFACLTSGASLRDAAEYIQVNTTTIFRLRKSDPEFAIGVKRAIKDGKMRLIRKVADATSWQAAAWMLERRWGREFGRHEKVEHAGTVRHEHAPTAMKALMQDPDGYDAAVQLASRIDSLRQKTNANGNGHAERN